MTSYGYNFPLYLICIVLVMTMKFKISVAAIVFRKSLIGARLRYTWSSLHTGSSTSALELTYRSQLVTEAGGDLEMGSYKGGRRWCVEWLIYIY